MTEQSSPNHETTEGQDIERRIRERAYELWELEGRPEGSADVYWHRAKELIEAETHSSYPPSQSRAHRT